MKNILVATDFSESSHKTLQYAILIAKPYKAKIYLLHTYLPYYTEPGIYGDSLLMLESVNEQFQSMNIQFAPFVKEIKEAGLAYETLLELNDVTSGVFDTIEKHEIDLLVIGRTGSGGFLNKLIGSNAAHITAKSTIPVLAIPQHVENVAIKQVLYATQLEFDESDILAQLFAITHELKAKVNLVKIEASFEPNIQSDEQFINQIKGTFVKENFEISTIKADNVSEGILKAAKKQGADLIVLASHHRNFLSQIVDPSKSKQVILSSPLPVLTFQLKEEL